MTYQQTAGWVNKVGIRLLVEQDLSGWNDEHFNRVLDTRFAQQVNIHHHRQIKDCTLVPPERIVSRQAMATRMDEAGFSFDAFGALFTELALLGPELAGMFNDPSNEDDTEHASVQHGSTLNVLNGGSHFNYETVYPDVQPLFDLVKRHKFHLDDDAIVAAQRSVLSVPDILLCVCLHRIAQALPEQDQAEYFRLAARTLDTRISNKDRLQDHIALEDLDDFALSSQRDEGKLWLRKLIRDANDALQPTIAVWEPADPPHVVIPLHGGDCSGAGCWARDVIADHPGAFLLPIGGHAPHQRKALEVPGGVYSEADEVLAAACVSTFTHRYGLLGSQVLPKGAPPLTAEDILFTADMPDGLDGASNAKQAGPAIAALWRSLNSRDPVHVLLITSHQHAARARMDFLRYFERNASKLEIPLPRISVMVVPAIGAMTNVQHARPVGLGNLFCEYIKRFYMVTVE